MRAKRSALLTFGTAIVLSTFALLITLVTPLRTGSSFLLFIAAIMLSAGFGGLGPGLLASLYAALASIFLVSPASRLDLQNVDDALRLGVFVVIALVVSSLTAARERARESARLHARRQSAVAELGQHALASPDLAGLFDRAAAIVAETLQVEYSHVLELLPDRDSMLLRAGHGWKPGRVGAAKVEARENSPAGYTLLSNEPVVVKDLRKETRLNDSPLLTEHQVVSGMSVIIHGRERPFGVLGAYTTADRAFSKEDLGFLQSMAHVLAEAVETRRAETHLREQREWLRVTLSSIGDGVVATDRQGRVTLINSVAERLVGCESDQAIGKSLEQIFKVADEKTGEPLDNPVARVIQGGSIVTVPSPAILITRDGRRTPVDDSAAPIRDDRGNLIGAVLIFRDVTERHRAEQALRDSEERYRTLAETASDAIITIDQDDRIQLVNQATERMFGYTSAELLGQPATILMPADQHESHRAGLADYLQTREKRIAWQAVELPGLRKDGKVIPLEISFGEFVRNGKTFFAGIVRDIGERRRAEEQLGFQANILRNVRDSVIVTDLKGQILYWNEGATGCYGYTADEVLGQSVARLYPDQREETLQLDLEQMRQGRIIVGEWQGRHKTGRLVWVDTKRTLMRDAAGNAIGFIGVSSDATVRKQAENRLNAQYRVTRALATSATIAEATPTILEAIGECVGWEVGAIWNVDRNADVLRCADIWHAPTADIREFEALTREMLFPKGVGLPGRVWTSRAPAWIANVTQDTNFPRAKVASKNGLRSAIGFPLVAGEQFAGVIEFFTFLERPPEKEMLKLLDALGSQIGQFIERKRTEDALRLSEEQHSIILQGVADGITAQDSSGRIIYANQAAARILGFDSPEELLDTPVQRVMERFEMLDEDGQPLALDRLPGGIALQTKQPHGALMRIRDLVTGQERWSLVNATPVLNNAGAVQYAINIFHDVTDLRRADQAIRQQRELLKVTLTSIGDAVISTDRDGNITFMNPIAEELTGWKLAAAEGQPLTQVFDIVNEETDVRVASPVERVLSEQRVIGLANHTVLVARDGRRIPVDDSGAPIRDEHGNVIGVVLVFRDITSRRRSEQDALRLAAIVKSSDDAIISHAMDGTIVSWNPGAERLYGYTAEEVVGQSIEITDPPDRLGEYESIIGRLKRGELVEHYDTMRMTKSGQRIDVSITVSLVRNADGVVVGVSKIARDITERKRAEEAARFLAEASDVLASSLDYETTLEGVAKLVAPRLADWCAVDIRLEDGAVQHLALAHADPAKVENANELRRRYPDDPNAPYGVYHVMATGKPEIVSHIGDDMIAAAARDREHLELLLHVGLKSYMSVPMIARGRTLGVITFVAAESGRHFGPADLALAQDLARRAAFAVDNARLYQQAQALNEELEQRVVRRTVELQRANRKLEEEIAERQRMNHRLRSLSGHLQSAREEERIRIAREIHDEIGQMLTAVKMDLAMLGQGIEAHGPKLAVGKVNDEIRSTVHLVDETIETMHRIVRELRPEVLDHLGLRAALEWQCQEFQTRTKIECRFETNLDDGDYDAERSTAVFRILQETLTNVARHAEATQVQATVKRADGQLILQVRDNGKGISPEELSTTQQFGLLGMRERALALGGEVDITGAPGQGTMVTARIPVGGVRHD
ncbi:MAG: PAS domain S-box protein [Chloroflexi bacterium]|nr:PAS domain S-box protein [Chloroflexota bacterium]